MMDKNDIIIIFLTFVMNCNNAVILIRLHV